MVTGRTRLRAKALWAIGLGAVGLAGSNSSVPVVAIRDVDFGVDRVARYGRLEVRFQVDTVATRPYYPYGDRDDGYAHPEGISVDAVVTEPEGQALRVPAFYCEPYRREMAPNGDEAIGIAGDAEWRVRFAPRQLGPHSLVLM